jgi:IclR family transcriptional regulator, acetate operon repressor
MVLGVPDVFTHMTRQTTKPVGSIERMFEILEVLKTEGGAGVTDVAKYLNIPKSTAHKHLSTLEGVGYVSREDNNYRVGIKFLELGGFAREQMKLYQTAQPEVAELAERTGEWSNLLVEDNSHGVYIHTEQGDRAVELDVYEGKRVPLHTIALGKAILAHKSRDEVQALIDRHGLTEMTSRTITDETELFEQLETIRKRGYAVDREERLQNLRCVAAPIVYDENDRVFGAVSVSGPTSRMKGERFEQEIPELVTSAANVISINMTYS